MTVRQIEGEWQTVVEVLRAAATVNADVEAYVEPAGPTTRPVGSSTFAAWDRAADGVAGLFAAHGAWAEARWSASCSRARSTT